MFSPSKSAKSASKFEVSDSSKNASTFLIRRFHCSLIIGFYFFFTAFGSGWRLLVLLDFIYSFASLLAISENNYSLTFSSVFLSKHLIICKGHSLINSNASFFIFKCLRLIASLMYQHPNVCLDFIISTAKATQQSKYFLPHSSI